MYSSFLCLFAADVQKIGLFESTRRRTSMALLLLYIITDTRAANRLHEQGSFCSFLGAAVASKKPIGQSGRHRHLRLFGFVIAHLFFVAFVGPPI